jgi:hypothetical protein
MTRTQHMRHATRHTSHRATCLWMSPLACMPLCCVCSVWIDACTQMLCGHVMSCDARGQGIATQTSQQSFSHVWFRQPVTHYCGQMPSEPLRNAGSSQSLPHISLWTCHTHYNTHEHASHSHGNITCTSAISKGSEAQTHNSAWNSG